MTQVLRDLETTCAMEGLKPGTPAYEFRLLQLRVQTCREMKRLSTCNECYAYDECTYVKGYFAQLNEAAFKHKIEKKRKAEERAEKEAHHFRQSTMEDGKGTGKDPGEKA